MPRSGVAAAHGLPVGSGSAAFEWHRYLFDIQTSAGEFLPGTIRRGETPLKRTWIVVVTALLASSYPSLWGNAPDRSRPPANAEGQGPAKSARLLKRANRKAESNESSHPLQGPDWIEMDEEKADHLGSNALAWKSSDGRFSITFTESPENEDDVAVYHVKLTWTGANKTQVDLGISTGAVISPDSKYVVLEPLKLIDTEEWKIYDLRKAFNLKEGYISVDRWSKDGKKFVVHSTQCAYDCLPSETMEYWLVELQ